MRAREAKCFSRRSGSGGKTASRKPWAAVRLPIARQTDSESEKIDDLFI
jgi:hypothetical protein